MGLFDYFRSSYNLGEHFTNTICQTKTIDDFGGTMTDYWLDPAGVLWRPDYVGTNTFEEIPEDDPRHNEKMKFLNFEWVPTGQHGKFVQHSITKYVEIYPAEWKGKWEDWPRLKIHFRRGIIQDYEDITGQR